MTNNKLPSKRAAQIIAPLQQDSHYIEFLKTVKEKVRTAQIKAALAVNYEMLRFYWELGMMMIEKQQQTQWGDKWIETLSEDLRRSFPNTAGYSRTNLHYMRQFAACYLQEGLLN